MAMADNADPTPWNQPRNLKEGVVKSFASLATGAAGVIVAPIATPWHAIQENGLQGLFAGVFQGLAEGLGFAVAGVTGFIAHPILALSCPAGSTSIPVLSCIMDREQVSCTRCGQQFGLSPLYQGPAENYECRHCRGLEPLPTVRLSSGNASSLDQSGGMLSSGSGDQLEVVGFHLEQAKHAAFAGGQLTTEGAGVRHVKFAGFGSWQLYFSGCTAEQLKSAGFELEDLKDAGFDLGQLKDAGFNARQLKLTGFDASQLKDAGFNGRQLKDAGFNARQLKDAGCNFRELEDAGFDAKNLKDVF